MSGGWAGSNRRAELPANWPAIRAAVLTRDGHQCTWTDNGERCTEAGTDVDHIRGRHNHQLQNLRALCSWHHNRKSSAEGRAAQTYISTKRPKKPHPGLL